MNTPLRHIFLDLDDTLNSLSLHLLKTFGCPINEFDYDKFPAHLQYDIFGAYQSLRPASSPDFTYKQFWMAASEQVWLSAPKSREFDFIIDRSVELVGKENITILTALPYVEESRPQAVGGKMAWIKAVLPDWLQTKWLLCQEKQSCSYPGTLLVDDADKNVTAFCDPKRGGSAILVPRPWNSRYEENTMDVLEREFDLLNDYATV